MEIKKGIYQHYKGNKYKVIGAANHSETLEKMVVYQALYGDEQIWVRPTEMWNELIEVDGEIKPRFKLVKESE